LCYIIVLEKKRNTTKTTFRMSLSRRAGRVIKAIKTAAVETTTSSSSALPLAELFGTEKENSEHVNGVNTRVNGPFLSKDQHLVKTEKEIKNSRKRAARKLCDRKEKEA